MYDRLAQEYDRMTRFRERLQTEGVLLEPWVRDFGLTTVLDAACGTGLHSIVLAKMGVRVTGTDLSVNMLALARTHAKKQNVKVRFVRAGFGHVYRKVRGPFDAVLCLGNSLPHLRTPAELTQALRDFHHLLRPGGLLLIQLLNYERILKRKERLIGVRADKELTFVRFYDFLEEKVRFNVLTLRNNGNAIPSSLRSTELFPYRKRNLLPALKKAGFVRFGFFGSLDRKPWSSEESADLVIACRKPE